MSNLEMAEKTALETLLPKYGNDYDYYLFNNGAYFDMNKVEYNETGTSQTADTFTLCFFNNDTDVTFNENVMIVSGCEKRFLITIGIGDNSYSVYKTVSVEDNSTSTASVYARNYYKTNYFELQSDSGSDSNVSLNVDTLIPYFLVLATLLCLIFFSLVFRRR